MIDREALRVRLVDILALFAPREGWEADHRIDGWLDRLIEAERPDPEVERLREALGLMDHAERDAEDELHEVEAVLQARLQRDAHVVAVEARLAAVVTACERYAQRDEPGHPYLLPEDGTRFLVAVMEASGASAGGER